ncbi:TonB family protein [Mucilaginibacter boryungensis]|uniref:TonB family protein n=1 Tax=Mucilaginibacter boryungensis TaxID=768480 RepID=A0ABR9XIT7_9SPHI|nr:TonB family protein [Mucilaginibacter boryungensis]MBE9667110.1 TonB family protein [Mucilaginibacter boryungensis]
MKSLSVCLIAFLIPVVTFSQTKYRTIYQDTIHLRGIVLDAAGKPIPKAYVSSKNLDLNGKGLLFTTTDALGRFELIGARHNDTIAISEATTLLIANNGSRYMEIVMPILKPLNITEKSPIVINATRQLTRKKIAVKYEIPTDDCLDCGAYYEAQATFPGGMDNFIKYIKTRLKYPELAVSNAIEGTVQIAFSISKDGSLIDIKVLRGIGYGCDEAVINILKNSPKWKPSISNGHALISSEIVTVQFSLIDKV